MDRFSFPGLVAKAVGGNKGWRAQWPDAELEDQYVVVGAGGHGLGTASALAKEHGLTDVAVVEGGRARQGGTICVPMPDATLEATVTGCVFVDFENKRLAA